MLPEQAVTRLQVHTALSGANTIEDETSTGKARHLRTCCLLTQDVLSQNPTMPSMRLCDVSVSVPNERLCCNVGLVGYSGVEFQGLEDVVQGLKPSGAAGNESVWCGWQQATL